MKYRVKEQIRTRLDGVKYYDYTVQIKPKFIPFWINMERFSNLEDAKKHIERCIKSKIIQTEVKYHD